MSGVTNQCELILARLAAIGAELAALPEGDPDWIRSFSRNKLDHSAVKVPAIVLLDGDEEADDADPIRGDGQGGKAARRVEMTPSVAILVQAKQEDIGTEMNRIRRAWLNRVLTDDDLIALCGGVNGYIRYQNTNRSYQIGRNMDGTMLVNVAFGYTFRPTA